ncbi:uncharacterized protein isoform X2 [Salmo salar]|uniref:Uncharacterized protein isoform X2 n=1 Tax=Salmo salar TaxID=8030 RepID=A0ABM3DLN2_SALSA|nr:uncharacterized protein LOC106567746 isoform X2 [Salmo salar]
MDGVTGYKREAKWNIATYRRDEEAPNLKLTMAQSQESKGLPLPVTQQLPVTQCLGELAAPRQQMKMTFYRSRVAGMEHVKYTVFLQFLIITALIQHSDGSCSACSDDRCAKVQTIYGSNDTIVYQRSNPIENLTSCSTTSAPPPQSQRCVVCLADIRDIILFCSDSWEAAGLLDWEVDGIRLRNIFMVDCPAMKTVDRVTDLIPGEISGTLNPGGIAGIVVSCAVIGLVSVLGIRFCYRKIERDRQERRWGTNLTNPIPQA